MSATEQVGQVGAARARRSGRRALVTTAVIGAAAVLCAAWWWASVPSLSQGTVIVVPISGYDQVERDEAGETVQVLQQNSDVGVFAFTVRNNGRVATTVSTSDLMTEYDGWVGPRVRIGFAPADVMLGLPASTEWSALDPSAVVQPGHEAWVVMRTLYPETCQATTSADGSTGSYGYDSVRLVATTLGRDVDVELPLAEPVTIPIPGTTTCTEADFVALDDAFQPR